MAKQTATEKLLTVGVFGFLLIFFMAATNFPSAWIVMVGLGAAHQVWPQVPALDYWTTFAILLAFRVAWPYKPRPKEESDQV